ncbi:MAG: class I SAM-dependent methyltransferase [Methanobacterium sp.]
MKIPDQEKYWDEVAERKEFPTPFHIEEFKKHVSKENKILDLGCGYGRILNELYNHGFDDLTGVDYSEGMINRGLRIYPNLNLKKNDGENLPFQDDEFDVVLLIGVLTSNYKDSEQEKMIAEILRVLNEDGIVYIADFLINHDKRNIERYEQYKNKYRIYGVFELPECAVLRHHTVEHILKLTDHFDKLVFEEVIYDTMNGHKSNGFYYMGKKK